VAGIQLEWPAGRDATLGMLAEIRQISGVPGLGGFANLFLYPDGIYLLIKITASSNSFSSCGSGYSYIRNSFSLSLGAVLLVRGKYHIQGY
jgi:hypothetical protein